MVAAGCGKTHMKRMAGFEQGKASGLGYVSMRRASISEAHCAACSVRIIDPAFKSTSPIKRIHTLRHDPCTHQKSVIGPLQEIYGEKNRCLRGTKRDGNWTS